MVLDPWKKTLHQLIKRIFSFNKVYSLIYHVLQQNLLLFEGESTDFFKRRSKAFHAD